MDADKYGIGPYRIALGAKVRDTLTPCEGVVTARTVWLNRCVRCGIQTPDTKENGEPVDLVWIDEVQLEVIVPTPGWLARLFARLKASPPAGPQANDPGLPNPP